MEVVSLKDFYKEKDVIYFGNSIDPCPDVIICQNTGKTNAGQRLVRVSYAHFRLDKVTIGDIGNQRLQTIIEGDYSLRPIQEVGGRFKVDENKNFHYSPEFQDSINKCSKDAELDVIWYLRHASLDFILSEYIHTIEEVVSKLIENESRKFGVNPSQVIAALKEKTKHHSIN